MTEKQNFNVRQLKKILLKPLPSFFQQSKYVFFNF